MATAAGTAKIVKTPGVRGGKARLEGTRICVGDLVQAQRLGRTLEQILEDYPSLSRAQVEAALSYYAAHRPEIEAEFEDEARFVDEAERRWAELVARHGGRPPESPSPEERALPRPFWPAKS